MKLAENTHPDPDAVPFMLGGSLFMHNPPIPMEICFPDGNRPKDASNYFLNPDCSCKVETGGNAVG